MSDLLSLPEFDAYWESVDADLARYDAAPELELLPLRCTDFARCYAVRLSSIGPYRIFGYYSMPMGDGPFPGLLITPRYGSVNNPPHYDDRERWQGYGLFGQNAALFVHHWDPAAPPEALCREVEAVATYLAKARVALRKQQDLGVPTTWASVHAALAAGEVRPSSATLDRFRKQARKQRSSLDVDARISERSLGRGLGRDVLARRLAAEILRGRLDVVTGRDPAEFASLGS